MITADFRVVSVLSCANVTGMVPKLFNGTTVWVTFSGNYVKRISAYQEDFDPAQVYGKLLYTNYDHFEGFYIILCTQRIFKIDSADYELLKSLKENEEIASQFRSMRLLKEFICL